MAKWEVDCEKELHGKTHDSILLDHEQRLRKLEDQGPRPGEIRAVNYVDGYTVPEDAFGNTGHPIPLIKHRLEQFWDGTWAPINVYHDPGNGKLERIKQ